MKRPTQRGTPKWYRDFVDSIENDELTYLVCEECGSKGVPPRSICPECGRASFVEKPLSNTAEVATFTEISVTIPRFEGQTPYTVVIGEFDEGVRL
ncbi:MAG: hypothetical protein SXQ77_02355, partial [Halobacteria archaeon]|nr:hypothetical protein [Halobacteria archaeon]